MQIREILSLKSNEIFSITPADTVAAAVARMVELGIGSLVVMRDSMMVGLITERDIVHGMAKFGCDLNDKPVSAVMVTEPVLVGEDDSVDYARDVMTKSRIGHVLVMDGNALKGVISFHDLAHAILKEAKFENSLLKRYIKHWPE